MGGEIQTCMPYGFLVSAEHDVGRERMNAIGNITTNAHAYIECGWDESGNQG